jgi:hypothetical protein
LTIADDFGCPEGAIRLGDVPTATTAMPKTTVNEHGNATPAEKEVRFAWDIHRMRTPAS